MSYIGKNPEADSVKLKGSATEPSGTSVDGQVYFNTGAGSISKGMKVYKNSQFVAIDKQLGDADTMQLLKAADIPAIDFNLSYTSTTVGGHGAVPFESSTGDFDGTAAFTNSSTGDALLTDDSADLVFHYTTQATNNAKNDFWGIPLTVPRAFRGGNLVLEMKYRTEIATGTMDDGYFNIAVLDRSASLQLTMSSTIGTTAIAAGSAVALAGKTYANPVTSTTLTIAVGDRVFVESGAGTASAANTGDIVDCYVTSVSSTANEITLSKAITPCNLGRITSGWLTGVEAINAFASDTNKDGTSKKIAFKSDADTQQVGLYFLVKGTSTVLHELFFDNVLLSANKFLQASSQTKNESYRVYYQNTFWDASTSVATFDASLLVPDNNTPLLADSKLVSVGDITGPSTWGTVTAIKALQDISLNYTIAGDGAATGEMQTYDSDGNIIGMQGPVEGTMTLLQATVSVNLAKDDYVFTYFKNPNSQYGLMTFTATPQTSPVILLESQDEIWTDWTDFTPVISTGNSGPTWYVARWRRNGPMMDVYMEYKMGTTSASEAYIEIPGGYSFDTTMFSDSTSQYHVLSDSFWQTKNNNSSDNTVMAVDVGQPTKIYPTYASAAGYHYDDKRDWNHLFSSGAYGFFRWSVPIQGWNSNFNPLLSMPLVDLGNPVECYACKVQASFWDASSGHQYLWDKALLLPQSGSPALADSNLISIQDQTSGTNTVTSIKAKQDITLSISLVGRTAANGYVGFYNSSDELICIQGQSENHWECQATGTIALAAGDYIYGYLQDSSTSYGNHGGAIITATKRQTGNMAHIIKPAVAIIKDVKAYDVGGGTSPTTWTARTLNTVEGESWFVTLNSTNTGFTLEAGQYEVSWSEPILLANQSTNRLYNVTDSSIIATGVNKYSGSTTWVQDAGGGYAAFTLTSAKEIALQTHVETSYATYGLGYRIDNVGDASNPSVYSQVLVRKLK